MLSLGATGIDRSSMHNSRSTNMKRLLAITAILLGATTAALAQGMGATSAARKPFPVAPDYTATHHHIPVKWHKHHHHKPAVHSSNKATSIGPQH